MYSGLLSKAPSGPGCNVPEKIALFGSSAITFNLYKIPSLSDGRRLPCRSVSSGGTQELANVTVVMKGRKNTHVTETMFNIFSTKLLD